jgi:hypothetical protein
MLNYELVLSKVGVSCFISALYQMMKVKLPNCGQTFWLVFFHRIRRALFSTANLLSRLGQLLSLQGGLREPPTHFTLGVAFSDFILKMGVCVTGTPDTKDQVSYHPQENRDGCMKVSYQGQLGRWECYVRPDNLMSLGFPGR